MMKFTAKILIFTMHFQLLNPILGVMGPAEVYAANFVCGQDLNGNGYLGDPGETASCYQAPQGWLCSVGAVDCNATFSDPLCPQGSTLNGTTDKCEVPPTSITCAQGYTYDQSLDICVQPVVCPSGGILNANTDKCEILFSSSLCPSGYTYDSANQACTKSISCPSGGVYSATRDRCELSPSYSCPTGYTYTFSTGKCEVAPSCASGSYNASTDKCTQTATVQCPQGYTWNSSLRLCTASGSCSGGSLNTSRDVCEASPSYNCPPGYSYYSNPGACLSTPSCPSGSSYNTTYDKCLAYASIGCAPGYTYNSSTGQCEQAPSCPSGGSYNATNNRCEASVSSTYQCSYSGSVYGDPTTCSNNCYQTATCNSSTSTTSPNYTNYCDSFGIGCPAGCGDNAVCNGQMDSWIVDVASKIGTTVSINSPYACPVDGTVYSDSTTCYNNCINALHFHSQCTSYTHTYTLSAKGIYANANGSNGWTLSQTFSVYQACDNITIDGKSYGRGTNINICANQPNCPSGTLVQTTTSDGFVGFYCQTTSYTCPLGGYSCGGSPPSCTAYYGCNTLSNCPSGYSPSGGVCIANPTCGSGGSLNGTTDKCNLTPSFSCSGGMSYDSALGYCSVSASCYYGGVLNTAYDACQYNISASCPGGYSFNSSTGYCQSPVSCGSGGSYNGSLDQCTVSNSWTCPQGMTLSGATCSMPSTCPQGGSLNTTTDKCEASATPVCTQGYSYDSATGVCQSAVSCNPGVFDPTLDKCKVVATSLCPQGYTFNSTTSKCEEAPPCLPGASYSTTADQCVIQADHQCIINMTYSPSSRLCESIPICSNGVYNPTNDKCYEGDNTCPLGAYTCMTNQAGTNQCSPNACFDLSVSGNDVITKVDDTMLQDDGPRDANGNCLGTVYLFSGRGSRCRPPGLAVGYVNNCCKSHQSAISDSLGTLSEVKYAYGAVKTVWQVGQIAYYANMWNTTGHFSTDFFSTADAVQNAVRAGTQTVNGVKMVDTGLALQNYAKSFFNPTTIAIQVAITVVMEVLMGNGCDQKDVETALLRDSNMCHYVGDYCEDKWPLLGCVQKAKGYCCFNSKMARIIHEQGRPQLKSFQTDGIWSSGASPNCRGFTPDEFQMLDFGKIDLSEYFGDIQTKANSAIGNIQQNATDKIEQYYQNIR